MKIIVASMLANSVFASSGCRGSAQWHQDYGGGSTVFPTPCWNYEYPRENSVTKSNRLECAVDQNNQPQVFHKFYEEDNCFGRLLDFDKPAERGVFLKETVKCECDRQHDFTKALGGSISGKFISELGDAKDEFKSDAEIVQKEKTVRPSDSDSGQKNIVWIILAILVLLVIFCVFR